MSSVEGSQEYIVVLNNKENNYFKTLPTFKCFLSS